MAAPTPIDTDTGELVERLRTALETPALAINRLSSDYLGEMVRKAWVEWAFTQPNPKPSWLMPYRDLSEPDKQADRDIGVALARIGATTFAVEHRFLFKHIIDTLSERDTIEAQAKRIADLEAEVTEWKRVAQVLRDADYNSRIALNASLNGANGNG